jgi:peroxiredoxin-like protein
MAQPPYYYQTEVEWTGNRSGQLRSPSRISIEVAAPPEFQGEEGTWTPEHLFVASVASCFMTTFNAIAELSKLPYVSFRCGATAKLEKVEGRGYLITSIELRPRLVIRTEEHRERAVRILEKAEKNCLISNSINSRVTLEPVVLTAATASQSV